MKKIIKLITVLCLVILLIPTLGACEQIVINDKETLPTPVIDNTKPNETIPNFIPLIPETTNPDETIQTELVPEDFTITLSFAGDCTLSNVTDSNGNGTFRAYASNQEPSYFLEKVKPIFENDDFTIVNLECVLSDQKLSKRNKGDGVAFWFKGKTEYANILALGDVEGVSLANNHTFDYGEDGFTDTKQAVTNVGLKYGYESDIMYFDKNGFVVAVICHGMWGEYESKEIAQLVKFASVQSDYQIVFYHGGTEKAHSPEAWRIRASKKLVDAGADLVIGNHPHVLQPIETYNGAQIVYSLGNFCYGGHLQPQNRTMIYQMALTIDGETLELKDSTQNIIPCYVYTKKYNNYQPTPIEKQDEIEKVIKFLNEELDLPY